MDNQIEEMLKCNKERRAVIILHLIHELSLFAFNIIELLVISVHNIVFLGCPEKEEPLKILCLDSIKKHFTINSNLVFKGNNPGNLGLTHSNRRFKDLCHDCD